MAYVVVRFLEEDETVSEVPSDWLEGENQCWWPSTKDVSSLINKRTPINKTNGKWQLYPISIVNRYDNYQAARKKADDVFSSSESEKGRGKRKKKINKKVISDQSSSDSNTEDTKNVLTVLPNFPITEEHNLSVTIDSFKEKVPIGSLPDAQIKSNCSYLPIFEDDAASLSDASCQQSSSDLPISNYEHDSDSSASKTQQRPDKVIKNCDVDLDVSFIDVSTDKKVEELREFVKVQFAKTHKMLAELYLLINNKNSGPVSETTVDSKCLNILKPFLPMQNLEKLQELEEILKLQDPVHSCLVQFLKTIGGNSPKEKIIRILRRLFSNSLISRCSWHGQRLNFKISNLKIISAVRDAVNGPECTDKLFEEVASDWVRQGKQRLAREEKLKE